MEIRQFRVEDLKLEGMAMIVITPQDEFGSFKLEEYGVGFVPSVPGISMVIEEKYIDQIDKFKLKYNNIYQPTLVLKTEETFNEPEIDADAARMAELQREMEALKQRQVDKDTVPKEEL